MAYETQTYWAAEEDSETAVSDIIKRIGSYRRTLNETGLALRMIRSFNAAQGYGPNGDVDASVMLRMGSNGEILRLNVNQYKTMAGQTTELITANKPAVKALPTNNDYSSLAQANFAEALNDYYDRELSVSATEKEAARYMVLFGESWVIQDWDMSQGEAIMVTDDDRLIKNGDVRVYCLHPFDVARDPLAQRADQLEWVAFRRRVNKWDLAAQYPEKKDEILAFTANTGMFYGSSDVDFDFFGRRTQQTSKEDDLVWMWEFRHIPTPALPKGRLVKFLDAKTILFDSVEVIPMHNEERIVAVPAEVDPVSGEVLAQASTKVVTESVDEEVVDHGYPYRNSLFAISSAPERIPGTSMGHTAFFDLLGMQEVIDQTATTVASAINAGGLYNLYVPRGANIEPFVATGALNQIDYDGEQRPVAEAAIDVPEIVMQFNESLKDWMQSRVSLNDVTTGSPSAGMPAQGMALLRAESIEFHSGLQESYEILIQNNRTNILKLLQIFADTERVAQIAGKGNHWSMREFKKQDIANFNRFTVEPVNPAMKTLAGRVSFAQPLLQGGIITPQQYLQLFSTGRLEPITGFSAANQARIERNKELLMQGIGLPPFKLAPDGNPLLNQGLPEFQDVPGLFVRPLISDTFWADIPEYLSILATPEIREVNAITQKVLQVVQYCMALWKSQPPAITATLRGMAYPGDSLQGAENVPPMGSVDNAGPKDPTTQVPNQLNPPMPDGQSPISQPKPPTLKGGDEQLQNAANKDPVLSNGKKPPKK